MSGIFRHKDGDWSSKKAIAVSFVVASIGLGSAAVIRAFYHPLADSLLIKSIVETFGGLGLAAALETTVVEAVQLFKSKKGKV